MRLYIATEHMTLLEKCADFESENLGGQLYPCLTRDEAVDAIRNMIHEQVECEHDGDPNYAEEDVDREADEIFGQADGTLKGDQWTYDATNRACVWGIEEWDVKNN